MQGHNNNNAFRNNRYGNRTRNPPSISNLSPGTVAFRIVCHTSVVGGVIGSSGSVVSKIGRDTSSRIHFEDRVGGSDHRVIVIIGSGSVERKIRLSERDECNVSCAQEALIRVFERLWKLEAAREGGGLGEEDEVYCGLLANKTQIGAIVGKKGRSITRMREASGARIGTMAPPPCAMKQDELIQISGRTLAVKKALVIVSTCLQDCPPLKRDPVPSIQVQPAALAERIPYEDPSDPHTEFFPHLSAMLPPMSSSNASNSHLLSMDVGKDPTLEKNDMQKNVVFKLLCSHVAAGAIIGKKGVIVRALQNQSGASIRFDSPMVESGERVVTISSTENLESWYSPAQNAVVLVFARSIEGDIEKGRPSGLSKGASVSVRLLVPSDVVRCLSDNGGQMLSKTIEATGASVQMLEEDFVSNRTSKEVVLKITGEYRKVQDALLNVTGKLRDNLLPPDVLNEVRVKHPDGKVRETALPGSLQKASLAPATDQETLASGGADQGLSGNTHSTRSSDLEPQQEQTTEREPSVTESDYEQVVKAFEENLELDRSMDFLLPREVLNEVGERSPRRGVSDSSSSGSQRSLNASLDSDQGSVLARGVDNLGFPDKITGASLQSFQTHETAGQKASAVLKKTVIVKNTTVEITVRRDVFGSVYGKDGCNLAHLRQISGAKVEVHDPQLDESEGTVVISGTPKQTQAAQSLLQAFILAYQ